MAEYKSSVYYATAHCRNYLPCNNGIEKSLIITGKLFINNLSDSGKHKVKIKFLTHEEIFNEHSNTTLVATEIGRFIQLIKAANLKLAK